MEGLLCYVCVLFVLTVEGTNTNISGLYCTDPDTGKLYEVNSTWSSQTFCGNYTCKLTKANVTKTEYTPLPKANITENKLNLEIEKTDAEKNVLRIKSDSRHTTDMAESQSEVIKAIKKVSSDMKLNVSKEKNINNELPKHDTDKRDRYLTEAEINVITEILHTVKRSDLEAIIEVYNLAEDIYKEMERSTKKKEKNNVEKPYLNVISCNDKNDMNTEGTTTSASRYYAYPANYFRGGLTANDYYYQFPYYYPLSDYQRTSPYTYKMTPQISNTQKSCSNPISKSIDTSTSARPARANDDKSTSTLNYSSLNIRQNIEDYARYYYNYYPWAQLEVYNKNRFPYYINPYYQQLVNEKPSKSVKTQTADKSKIPKEVKPKSIVIKKELPLKKTEEKKESMPKWKTEQLSQQVIDEVKANVLDETKLLNIFPRKSIQLERVGKVIKLDELSRSKRQAEMKERVDFGVRLEKIECVTSTEPGYFSVGNLSAPYPDCCPQKIT